MFCTKSFTTFKDVDSLAKLIGIEGIQNAVNSKDADYTVHGKLIKSAYEYANKREITIKSVNDGNNVWEEILTLAFSEKGVSIVSYYHTMIGSKNMKELIEHDYSLFKQMMDIASDEYEKRYKNLKHLQAL